MARKGNQQKNGVDHNASSHRKRCSNSGSASPDMTRQGRDSKVKGFPGEELPNGSHPGIPSMFSLSKSHNTGDESIRKQNSATSPRIEKQGANTRQDPEPSFSSETILRDRTENISSRETCGVRVENVRHGRKNKKSGLGLLVIRLHIKNVMENAKFSDHVLVRSYREYVASITKAAIELLERNRPLFVTLTTYVYNAHDYVLTKIRPVYPVVLNYLMQFAKIMLLLSMLWLDFILRGIDSFLRMGTTSFFSIIWCSVLSVIAMVGMLKFFLVLFIVALVALFVGLALAIIVVAISGTVFLWFYGSFWTTLIVICLGGFAFKFTNERLALFVTTVYSVYCAWSYVGWLGLLLALNLSFISSDALIFFLKNNISHHGRSDGPPEQTPGMQGGPGFFNGEQVHPSFADNYPGLSADCNAGVPSTSGTDSEMTSEDAVVRLLNCTNHYSALGLTQFEDVDVSALKREYRKKAMLVHPDKNMGNEKAVEAFKKLQNAYEVLLDSFKRKTYDDELRREELFNLFRSFQSASQKNGQHGFFTFGSVHPEADGEDLMGESRRIACKKCNGFHVWVETKKSKSQARWCQECKDYHQAKDGDGWVEQSSQQFFFGLLQKVDVPFAYVCTDSGIYNATEWYICQGMRCPTNTHKPTFHVNTSVTSKHSSGKGTSLGQRGGRMPTPNLEDTMTEEELFEWLQNAMQSGMFENFGGSTSTESPTNKGGTGSKISSTGNSNSGRKRKKKGKKQCFSSKPDEDALFFPEAVLLKEKKVLEDGRVLPKFADAEEAKLYEYLQLKLESQVNVEQRRHYEVVYLIHEKHEEEVESVNEKVQGFLREKKGRIWRLNDWGLRRLAYKIKKAKNAHYMLMNFELEAKWINDFKTMLDKDERVIRHLVIKREKMMAILLPSSTLFVQKCMVTMTMRRMWITMMKNLMVVGMMKVKRRMALMTKMLKTA